MAINHKKIAVAMSGGVDSSMAAALLQREGHDIFGITMDLGVGGAMAPWVDAGRVAEFLGIPHYCVDLQAEFRDRVIDYFTREYQCGRTPSPCVVCNPLIKFAALYEKARDLGATHLATGHYVRVMRQGDDVFLRVGSDPKKDQSYFLSRLSREQIEHSVFPLGELSKSEVRQQAAAIKLPVASKSDSQEICFIPDDDYRKALHQWSCGGQGLEAGDFVDVAGKFLGRHLGLINYTVGQRKGLGLALGFPAYVVALDPDRNRVVVGTVDDLSTNQARVDDCVWNLPHSWRDLDNYSCLVKIRSAAPRIPCKCQLMAPGRAIITFEDHVRAVTPGQAAAFYHGDCLIGGGFFAR
jgi:tRNA-specific 2-thiouridylase